MLQFMAFSVCLAEVNKLPIEADKYRLEGITKCSVEYFSKPFDMMIQQERVKQLSSGVSMGGDFLSKWVKTNPIVKLANNSYRSLCKSGAFNVPTSSFNSCFNCNAPDHDVGSFPQKRYQKKISGEKKKFIKIKKIQGENGGVKTWDKISNKKCKVNKSQNKQKINNKSNGNGGTKSNNGVQLVEGKCMWLCNKVCGFNTTHTTGFHDTWATCVKNNQPVTLPATHLFKNKLISESVTVTQVDSNNGGGTQFPTPTNGVTATAPIDGLHHMGAAVLASQYVVQTKSVCEHHKNSVSDTEIYFFIAELQKAWNLN